MFRGVRRNRKRVWRRDRVLQSNHYLALVPVSNFRYVSQFSAMMLTQLTPECAKKSVHIRGRRQSNRICHWDEFRRLSNLISRTVDLGPPQEQPKHGLWTYTFTSHSPLRSKHRPHCLTVLSRTYFRHACNSLWGQRRLADNSMAPFSLE